MIDANMDRGELAALLRQLGIKQTELAALVGVSAIAVNNWVKGRRQVPGSLAVLMRLLSTHPELLDELREQSGQL